jgi:hypothetical protein
MPGLVGQVKNVDTDTDRYAVPNSNCRANSVVMITPVYSDEPGEALPTSYSVEAVNGGFYVRGDSTQWSFNYMIVNP